MIINDKSVKGVYVYNESAEYEKGDFVVDGDCIFICTANSPTDTEKFTVKGQKPIDANGKINTENYKAYPGDLITSAEEYYQISKKKGEGIEDKYVSSYALSEILRKSYFGIDEAGLITDHVLYSSEDGSIDYSVGSKTIEEWLDEPTSVLTKILLEPELNNGIVKISRDLPELKDLFIDQIESDQNITEDNYSNLMIGPKMLLLRQYTYIEDHEKYRVQELLDPRSGESYYRHLRCKSFTSDSEKADLKDDELVKYELEGGYVSAWRSNFGGSTKTSSNGPRNVIERYNSILKAYSDRLNEYSGKLDQLNNSFRFQEVEGDDKTKIDYADLNLTINSIITVTCIYNTSSLDNISVSFSASLPIITTGNAVYYLGSYENNKFYLHQIVVGNSNKFYMNTNPTINDSNSANCSIANIYYRRVFDREKDATV